jgi:hypothetical protein
MTEPTRRDTTPQKSAASKTQTNPAPAPVISGLFDQDAVVQLQRLAGNRAVGGLLGGASQRKSPAAIQRLMSLSAFKESSKKSGLFSGRGKLKKVDAALKKVEQVGIDMGLLSELKDAIDHWLSVEPESSRRPAVEILQAEVGAEIQKIVTTISEKGQGDGAQPQTRSRSNAMSFNMVGAGKKYKKDFSDFDSKQFRVSGRAPNRVVEEVKRTVGEDGKVTYYATGLVTGFNGKAPAIAPYPEPISLGDWYPAVTHINGMAVAPKSGIQSAMALQESVNSAMGGTGDVDVAMGQDAIDVLYTYSAQRGGMVSDVWDCIKGKVGVEDPATEKQIEIMLDAVRRKKRVTVSAHSRGTIKTDNAVMEAHKILSAERLPQVRTDMADSVREYWEANDPGMGFTPEMLAEISFKGIADKQAKEEMNLYIHLIYAGNAVQYPSSIVPPTLYAGGLDFVSMFVGSYTKLLTGAKSPGAFKGHGFVGNYVPHVGKEISDDIKKR